MKRGIILAGAIAAPLTLATAAHAAPTLWFAEDFESSVDTSIWSPNFRTGQTPDFTTFAGNLGAEILRVRVDQAPDFGGDTGQPGGGGNPPQTELIYTLTFDLYIIDTWDGFEPSHGEDHLEVMVNGVTLFDEAFANQHSAQTFRAPDQKSNFGYASWDDSIYRSISLEFAAPQDPALSIRWVGHTTQAIADESWGVDNISLEYEHRVVPAPGAAALLGLAGLTCARRRR